MKNPNISKALKAYRKLNRYSVNDVVLRLAENHLSVAEKTIYGWDCGRTQPDADTLLILCMIYKIDNILETFGYNDMADELLLSREERDLILKYRSNPDMQPAIKKLLNMNAV